MNVVLHASSLGIVAVGVTIVLLTAGIDLSVGAVMFLAAIAAAKMAGAGVGIALASALAVALAAALVNVVFIVKLRLPPFVVTLATLYVGRGFGLWVTETRALALPESMRAFGAGRIAGIPIPVITFAFVAVAAHLVLTRTALGRQVYATGHDRELAARAGVPVDRILTLAYLASGLCAGLAGFVAVAQIGVVSPSFGQQRELTAIAAAVLGGASLFGGRGRVLPGTLAGVLLIQSIETALVMMNVDPYLYPLITATVIFLAVAIDGLRQRKVKSWLHHSSP